MAGPDVNKSIVYLSEYEHGVDDKRRIQIPAKWRPSDESKDFELMVLRWQLPGQPPCLLVLPPAAKERLSEKMASMPFADPKAETLRRLLTSNCDCVSIDGAGRMTLPQKLAQSVGINKTAVLVGMWDRFQVWSPENRELVKQLDAANEAESFKLI